MKPKEKKDTNYFANEVGEKANRKLKALGENKRSVWFALGIWMDKKHPESFSWTLTCLILGLFAGCLIAWHWMTKEHKEMNQKDEKDE